MNWGHLSKIDKANLYHYAYKYFEGPPKWESWLTKENIIKQIAYMFASRHKGAMRDYSRPDDAEIKAYLTKLYKDKAKIAEAKRKDKADAEKSIKLREKWGLIKKAESTKSTKPKEVKTMARGRKSTKKTYTKDRIKAILKRANNNFKRVHKKGKGKAVNTRFGYTASTGVYVYYLKGRKKR